MIKVLAVLLLSMSQVCLASSLLATTDGLSAALSKGVESGSDSSSSAFGDKRVVAATDEAASFVASAGAVQGAQLNEALSWLRSRGYQGSDLVLAEAILARSH